MHFEAYVADCDDGGLLSELKSAGVEPEIHRKYLYATGADDPGIWLVFGFVGTSILGGFIHDAFKIAIRKAVDFAKRRASTIEDGVDDNGPYHTCIVLENERLKIEIALGELEIDLDWIEGVVKRCESIVAILESEELECSVQLPVEEFTNHWDYSRRIENSGYRYWTLHWKDGETIVYDDQEKVFHRNAEC